MALDDVRSSILKELLIFSRKKGHKRESFARMKIELPAKRLSFNSKLRGKLGNINVEAKLKGWRKSGFVLRATNSHRTFELITGTITPRISTSWRAIEKDRGIIRYGHGCEQGGIIRKRIRNFLFELGGGSVLTAALTASLCNSKAGLCLLKDSHWKPCVFVLILPIRLLVSFTLVEEKVCIKTEFKFNSSLSTMRFSVQSARDGTAALLKSAIIVERSLDVLLGISARHLHDERGSKIKTHTFLTLNRRFGERQSLRIRLSTSSFDDLDSLRYKKKLLSLSHFVRTGNTRFQNGISLTYTENGRIDILFASTFTSFLALGAVFYNFNTCRTGFYYVPKFLRLPQGMALGKSGSYFVISVGTGLKRLRFHLEYFLILERHAKPRSSFVAGISCRWKRG